MSRVFISPATGAGVYVFSDDHCPPHVHARHRTEGWIARIRFSYITNAVELISIAPLKRIPLLSIMNMLVEEVRTQLAACRRTWWEIRRTVCLTNQWVALKPSGQVEICQANAAQAKQIASAAFDPEGERLRITFGDGTDSVLGGIT
jgi:hypothetical protein